MADVLTFTVKDATTIRDDMARTLRNGFIRAGVADPVVGPGSDWWVLCTAVGNELAVVQANAVIKADEQMPDTATGVGLARIASILGLAAQPAGGSVGSVVITCSADTPIPVGHELLDTSGLRYRVTTGGTYSNGASVPIEAVDTGFATNHAEGDVLTWKQAPPFCDTKVTVDVGGLVNGIDAEDDEALRARVLAVLQTPPGSGNWEHVAEIAEEADPRVQKAFVHPAALGPSTIRIVVVAAPTSTSQDRDVDATVLSGTVAPYIRGKLPEHADLTITTVTNTWADVAIGLSLPEAVTASPPGPGGGWKDGTPWPAPDGTTVFECHVTAVTSSTVFTVDVGLSGAGPQVGVSRVCWYDPTTATLYRATVTASTSLGLGLFRITLDKPFSGIAVGAYIWPDCEGAARYVDALLQRFAAMGPGEVSTSPSVLRRGFRHPIPANGWPTSLGPHLLQSVTSAGDEVLSAQFFQRTANQVVVSDLQGAAGTMVPDVPLDAADPPGIFVPRNLAFYRIP